MNAPSRLVIGIGSTAAASLAYGAGLARQESTAQNVTVLAGVGGLVAACLVWLKQDAADTALEDHPALMNGYFLTGGVASALSDDPGQVAVLRGLMGVPAPRRRRRRATNGDQG
jgi:hypothetical protein